MYRLDTPWLYVPEMIINLTLICFNDIALLQQNLLYFSKEQIFVDDKKVDDVYLNKESWNICDSNNYF